MFGIKTDKVTIRNIGDQDIRTLADKADKLGNRDGILTPEEAQKLFESQTTNASHDLFDKAVDQSHLTKLVDVGLGSGVPMGLGVLSRMARINPLWHIGYKAVGSASEHLNAYEDGRISGTRAVTETVVDTAIAGSAAAAGAMIGAAAGSVVPVAGTVLGFVVGTSAGFIIDHLMHKAVDPIVDGVLQDQ